MATAAVHPVVGPPTLSSDEILKIARLDAERVYRDPTPYRIRMVLEPDGWHVDYELKDPHERRRPALPHRSDHRRDHPQEVRTVDARKQGNSDRRAREEP